MAASSQLLWASRWLRNARPGPKTPPVPRSTFSYRNQLYWLAVKEFNVNYHIMDMP